MTRRKPPGTPRRRPLGKRPCKRCRLLIRRQHGRQFCGGCTRHVHSQRRWHKGERQEWL